MNMNTILYARRRSFILSLMIVACTGCGSERQSQPTRPKTTAVFQVVSDNSVLLCIRLGPYSNRDPDADRLVVSSIPGVDQSSMVMKEHADGSQDVILTATPVKAEAADKRSAEYRVVVNDPVILDADGLINVLNLQTNEQVEVPSVLEPGEYHFRATIRRKLTVR